MSNPYMASMLGAVCASHICQLVNTIWGHGGVYKCKFSVNWCILFALFHDAIDLLCLAGCVLFVILFTLLPFLHGFQGKFRAHGGVG